MTKVLVLMMALAAGSMLLAPKDALPVYSSVLATPFEDSDCTVSCDDQVCAGGEHYAWESSIPHNTGDPHNLTPCLTGTCGDYHPWCRNPDDEPLTSADMDLLREALASEDLAASVVRLSRAGTAAEINVQRSAVQLLDCRGLVVAHLPLRTSFVAELANSL
jgi:hypothetical protein